MRYVGASQTSQVAALVRRDVRDAVHNRTVLVVLAACFIFTLVFRAIAEQGVRFSPGEAPAFLMASVIAMAPAFVGCTVSLYVMAEERERGVYITLAEAGVTLVQVAVAKLCASIACTLATEAIMFAVAGVSLAASAAGIAISVFATVPVLCCGVACGLLAREQMSSSILAVPITLIMTLPLLSFMSEGIRRISLVLPMGSAAELVRAFNGMEMGLPLPVVVGVGIVWAVAGFAFLVWAHARAARDLAAQVDRLR